MRNPKVFELFTESLNASGNEMGALIEKFNPKIWNFSIVEQEESVHKRDL